MNSISYVSGTDYNFLAIAKKKAQQYGIENPKDVEIKATKNGLLLQRKKEVASARDTGDNRDTQSRSDSEDEYHE